MNLQGKKVNFLGDSITQGVGTSHPSKIYLNLLQESADLACARNYGISGTRFARQTNPTVDNPSFDRDFVQRVDEMDPDADLVVVFGGTNDYGHGDAKFGDFTSTDVYTFYGAARQLCEKLIEKYPEAVIVFLTPLHRSGDHTPNASNHLPLLSYVQAIRQVAEEYALPVLDLYATAGIQPNLPIQKERFCPDGLHPNDAGHQRLAARLQAFLEQI